MNATNPSLNLSTKSEDEIIISILEADTQLMFTYDKISYQVTDLELTDYNKSVKLILLFISFPISYNCGRTLVKLCSKNRQKYHLCKLLVLIYIYIYIYIYICIRKAGVPTM